MSDIAAAGRLDPEIVAEAVLATADIVRHTPVLSSRSLSHAIGGEIRLKAENLQRTGSFKLRGGLTKIARLGERARAGVVAGSAGNHAQSLAYAARARGIACEVFMPSEAAVSKVAAVESFGGTVRLGGDSVDECVARARERSAETGAAFVHPFDDLDIVHGQATLGLELLEDVPELAKVIVPVGGGGLISGIAAAVKARRPDVVVTGVQVAAYAPYPASLAAGKPIMTAGAPTIADGIAIKRPGEVTLPLVRRFVDEICVVDDEDVADAMVLLMERAKLVVEGAGAVGVAALVSGRTGPAPNGVTLVVLSGGNVDAGLLAAVTRRHESVVGRRMRLYTRIPDRPGGLAAMLDCVAQAGGNLIEIHHVREAVRLRVRETGVQLTVETRGRAHTEAVVKALQEAGYPVDEDPTPDPEDGTFRAIARSEIPR